MSAYVLLNLFDELRKTIRCEALSNILSFFSTTSLINLLTSKDEIQNFICHLTLNWHFIYYFTEL